jgi:hypothetical protein
MGRNARPEFHQPCARGEEKNGNLLVLQAKPQSAIKGENSGVVWCGVAVLRVEKEH